MSYCGHWLSSVTYFVLWISFFTSLVALFAPLWYSTGDPPLKGYGLFLSCEDPYNSIDDVITDTNTNCTWRGIGKDNPAWFTACQAMWVTGAFLLLVIAFTSFFVCCDSCRRASCQGPVFGTALVASFLFMITDIVFGVYHYNDLFVEMNRLRPFYFDWGYYVAIVAAILSFISAIMFGSLSFCINRKTHEYEMET